MLSTVEHEHPHLLVVLVEHERLEVAVSGIGVDNLESLVKLLALEPPCNLDGGKNLQRLHLTHTTIHASQVVVIEPRNLVNLVVMVVEQPLAQVHDVLAGTAAANDDGEEFRRRQVGEAIFHRLLAWPVVERRVDFQRPRLSLVGAAWVVLLHNRYFPLRIAISSLMSRP